MNNILRETIYKELVTRYKKDKKGGVNDLLVEYSGTYDLSLLKNLKKDAQKSSRKGFRIIDIIKIETDLISDYSFTIALEKDKENELKVTDATGIFKIIFSDDSFMYYSKWVSGDGKQRVVEGMFASERNIWLEFLKMINKDKKRNDKPKKGIFRIASNGGFLEYKKMEDLQETPVIHPSSEILLKDINYYFNNVQLFTRFGMSGVRKGLMVGPPGTGKTSLAVKISKKFADNKCVVFSTSIADIAQHLQKCATHKVSTLAILEDAESTLQQANSALLNFLDGVDQPKNLLGSYIIMTTNYPERIESRIIKRPGRIDKIIEFGNLTGSYALKCAEQYFEEILFNDKNRSETKVGAKLREEIYPCINNMSGAEIKELAQASASYAASEGKDVDIELIKAIKKRMREDIQDISKYAAESSSMTKRKGIGFNNEPEDCSVFNKYFLEEVASI